LAASVASSINLFGVVAGLLLMRGSLRAAVVVRWMVCSILPGMLLFGLMLFAQPLDLTLTQMRLAPVSYFGNMLLMAAQMALLYWLQKQLGLAPVLAAREADGRKAYQMRVPTALGVVTSLAGLVFFYLLLFGERGQHAEQLARQQLGPQLRYHTNGLHINSNDSGTYVHASVMVWSQTQVGSVAVNWKE